VRIVAALAAGVTAFLLVGLVSGELPARPLRSGRRRGHTEWLRQAGLDLSPRQFLTASLATGAGSFLVMWLVSGIWTVAAVPAVVMSFLPRAWYGRRRAQRIAEVQQAWPDGLRDMIASISAGMSLSRAIEILAVSGPPPLRAAFARYPGMARTMGVVRALEAIKESLAHPTSDRVIEVLILAHERGGGIVPEVLRDLAAMTTRDVWTAEEIETAGLEQKLNARMVFAIPWLVLLFITLRPGPFRDFYLSGAGVAVIVLGGVMSGLGMVVVSRLGREPDEPRVLGG
jgi:tight adherence protein B